ncbi:MAG: ABC transporter permease [Gaiellaceae bacterium]
MRSARILALGWLFHFKIMSRSAFDGLLAVLWPIFFATVAFFMFRAGNDPDSLLFASLGAAVMGVWTATSVPASSALQRARWHGTLELLVAAPVHFALVLLPITIATATIGVYCMTATLLWGRFAFGIDLTVIDPVLFVVAVPATIVSIGTLGFLLAVAFVRYRTAWAMGAVLEYPVWLVCGFLVPISLFPGWVRPISWALAPTWGMNAVRESALGGSPLADVLVCLALGAGYTVAGIVLLESVLRAARARATLALT